jgi:6-phosphogluconolactonase
MIPDDVEILPDAKAMAFRIATLLKQADTSNLSIVLPGGNTPRKIFQNLATDHSQLPWNSIHFFWGDERCVPPDHPDSNYKMARDHLFDKIPSFNGQIHRIRGEDPPETEKERYQSEIIQHVKQSGSLPVFDLVLLGLGEDGHVASIFPDQMHLLSSKKICEEATHPVSGQKRITLTGTIINQARTIVFLVSGKKKSSVLSRIFEKNEECTDYPACFIKPVNGKLLWLLDRETSSFFFP